MAKNGAIEFIARGALFEGSRVLLCRNLKHGYYFLPGGHVEFGEAAAAALVREFVEECGLEVKARDCLLVTEGVFQSGKREHHEVNLVFHVEQWSNDPAVSRESDIGFEWVELAAVADIDLRPPAIRAWLAAGPHDAKVEWVSEIPRPGEQRNPM